MATPERPIPHISPTETDLRAALAEINQKLELVDEVESPLGRVLRRDRLLELQSELEADLNELFEQPFFSDPNILEDGQTKP